MKQKQRAILVTLVVVALAGVAIRWIGLGDRVTYIDEMIVLAEGRWNVAGEAASLGSGNPLEFAKKIAASTESSYAPAQFLVTYFLVNAPPLTWENLQRSRWVSAILGSLSIPLFLVCAWRNHRSGIGLAILTPAVLFSFSVMHIINSQQNHSYVAGVTFGLLAVLCFDMARTQTGTLRRTVWLMIPGFFPLVNYQLMLINVALAVVLGVAWLWAWWIRGRLWRELPPAVLPLAPLGALTLLTAVGLATFKSDLSVTWWVSHFGFQGGLAHAALDLPRKFFDIFYAVLLVSQWHILTNICAALLGLCLLTGVTLALLRRKSIDHGTRFYLFASLSVMAVFIALYFLRRIPLSPSRHMLVLTPLLLLALYHVLQELEDLLCDTGAARGLGVIYVAFPMVIAIAALLHFPTSLRESRELLTPGTVLRVLEQAGTRTIVTGHWDYNRVLCILSSEVRSEQIEILSIKDQDQYPDRPFLLIGHYPEVFRSIYELRSGSPYQARLLVHDVRDHDVEPSPYVRYWPNRLFIWHVSRADQSPPIADTMNALPSAP